MRPLLLPASVLCVLSTSLLGCSSGPACAVDTDCPLASRCGDDGTCQLVGAVLDSGPVATDTGPRDAMATDARTDSGPVDAGPPDGGNDTGPTCPATAGVHPLTTVGIACAGRLTALSMTLTADVAGAFCSFTVQLGATDSGTLAPSDTLTSRQLGGSLLIGGASFDCVATFDAGRSVVDVSCSDGCTFSASLP